jgi:hypothetical protein
MEHMAVKPRPLDPSAIDYPAVKTALTRVINLCLSKLTPSDMKRARAVLHRTSTPVEPEHGDLLFDSALFSLKDNKKRAIDRIAPKLAGNHDPLVALVAARLATSTYTVFAVASEAEDGIIIVHDLLGEGRALRLVPGIADYADPLQVGALYAGRLIDIGPWWLGTSSFLRIEQPEADAIGAAMARAANPFEGRESLHETIYKCAINGYDLAEYAAGPFQYVMKMAGLGITR